MEDTVVVAAGLFRFRGGGFDFDFLACPLCFTAFENLDAGAFEDPAPFLDVLVRVALPLPAAGASCSSRRTISFRLRFSISNLSLARLPISFTFSSMTILDTKYTVLNV